MKLIGNNRQLTGDYRRYALVVLCLLSVVCCLMSVTGCIRVSGNAGYSKVEDDEIVTKSTGFDLDSSRLLPDQRGVAS